MTIGDVSASTNLIVAARANVRRAAAIRRALRALAPDVVISFVDRMNVLALLATWRTGVPTIVAERIDPRRHPVDGATRLLRLLLYPTASAVVVQTTAVAAWARRRGLRRVVVMPNWVTPGFAPRDDGHPTCPQSGTVVGAGRLAAQKGFDLLIEAFASAAQDLPGWRLAIFGQGPDLADLRRSAERAGLGARAYIPGETAELERVFADADVFALSSRYEGFPNVLLEAMASGLAVVAFDCDSGPRDIVHDRVDGILAPAGDVASLARELRRLMDDPVLRQQLGQQATTVRSTFDKAEIGRRWLALADRLGGR